MIYGCHHGFSSTVPITHSVMLADGSGAVCSLVAVPVSADSGTTHDPEPQPGDGPDYHADHAAWVARNVPRPSEEK